MIVKRLWYGKWDYSTHKRKCWCGWFLLGLVPLYIEEVT